MPDSDLIDQLSSLTQAEWFGIMRKLPRTSAAWALIAVADRMANPPKQSSESLEDFHQRLQLEGPSF